MSDSRFIGERLAGGFKPMPLHPPRYGWATAAMRLIPNTGTQRAGRNLRWPLARCHATRAPGLFSRRIAERAPTPFFVCKQRDITIILVI